MTHSVWETDIVKPVRQKLTTNETAEVCVIGAGIAGLTTAYLLAKEGKKVILLEKNQVGSGESGRTTAQFSTALDSRYQELVLDHGIPGIQLAYESHAEAIEIADKIIQDEKINCDRIRVPGYLIPGESQKLHDETYMKTEYDVSLRARVSCELVHPVISTLPKGPWIRYNNQLQLHPLKYLKGLAEAFEAHGGKIFTHSHVTSVEVLDLAFIRLDTGVQITADYVVMATNTPVNNRYVMHTKQAAYRTYVISAEVPKGVVPLGLYWDTEAPYHYVRLDTSNPNYDLLLVGGGDHKVGQDSHPEEKFTELKNWTKKHFPMVMSFKDNWSGQVLESIDGLGYAGRNPTEGDHCFIITGGSGNGMTHGTLGARLVADLILGFTNSWEKLYAPNRITLREFSEFFKENANTFAQYRDWFKPSELSRVEDLLRGQAAIIHRGLSKVGVYRDENGEVHSCSVVCPHLGAILRWNSAEKTWDCPAHGSRFTCKGKVIMGPAISNLNSPDNSDEPPTNDIKIKPIEEPDLSLFV